MGMYTDMAVTAQKNDVDPRDVHKLLPETMMASDSLDLHSELIHGKINQVIHDIMDAQVVQDIEIPGGNRGRRIPVVEEEAHHYADAQVSQLTRLMPSVELGAMDLGLRHRGSGQLHFLLSRAFLYNWIKWKFSLILGIPTGELHCLQDP